MLKTLPGKARQSVPKNDSDSKLLCSDYELQTPLSCVKEIFLWKKRYKENKRTSLVFPVLCKTFCFEKYWNSIYKKKKRKWRKLKKKKRSWPRQHKCLHCMLSFYLYIPKWKKNPSLFLNADFFSFVLTFVPLAMCLKKCKVDLDCM